MMPIIDEYTGAANGRVQNIMEYLFATYGNISDQSLNEIIQKTINHTYVHSNPISNVFNIIHKYAITEEYRVTPETSQQLISIGKIITTNATSPLTQLKNGTQNLQLTKHGPTSNSSLTPPIIIINPPPIDTIDSHVYSSQANVAEKFLQETDHNPPKENQTLAKLEAHRIINEHTAKEEESNANATATTASTVSP